MMFLKLCQYQKLNPFLNEAYLVKFGNEKAQIIVGKDVFMRRLSNSPLVEGYQAGIIVRKKGSDEIQYRNGTFYVPGEEQLLGGWSRIWRKGWKEPVEHSVSLHEYIKLGANKEPQAGWKKAATQIRKVALVQNAREVVPDLRQLYISEEMQVDEEQLQNEQVEFTIHDAEEEVQEETQEVEYASDNEFISDPPITVKQVKRLYAIAHGDVKLINDIIEEYGYEKLQDIRRGDYEAICNAVQSALLEQEEQLSDITEHVVEEQ